MLLKIIFKKLSSPKKDRIFIHYHTLSGSMKILSLVLLTVFIQNAVAQIKIIPVDKKKIPQSIRFSGHIIDAVEYTDVEGQHLMITTETGNVDVKDEYGTTQQKADVFAYNYIIKVNQYTLSWQMHDFTIECQVDTKAKYIPNTFGVTDLDNNGKAEVWLMYVTSCRGDVSPASMKIIMHEGSKKYAIRGENLVKVNDKEHYGGKYTMDEAFKTGPEVFRQYATQLWKKNILEKF